MNLHEERIQQIRERIETDRTIPGDAQYLLAALDHAISGNPETYQFALLHEAVVDADGLDCA